MHMDSLPAEAPGKSYLEKHPFRSAHFLNGLVGFFDVELHKLFVYFGDYSLSGLFVCKYFLPFCGLSFSFVYGFLVEKLLSLIRSYLFVFVFISL